MRPALLIATVLVLTACGGGGPESDGIPADSVTQRQRDSAIGASGLPGAGGVRGALDAADAAAARSAAIDSAAGGR